MLLRTAASLAHTWKSGRSWSPWSAVSRLRAICSACLACFGQRLPTTNVTPRRRAGRCDASRLACRQRSGRRSIASSTAAPPRSERQMMDCMRSSPTFSPDPWRRSRNHCRRSKTALTRQRRFAAWLRATTFRFRSYLRKQAASADFTNSARKTVPKSKARLLLGPHLSWPALRSVGRPSHYLWAGTDDLTSISPELGLDLR